VGGGGGAGGGRGRFKGLPRDSGAVAVEERKLPPGVGHPALEVTPLRVARPWAGRNRARQILARHAQLGAVLALRCSTHARLPLTMIKDALTSSFLRYAKPIG